MDENGAREMTAKEAFTVHLDNAYKDHCTVVPPALPEYSGQVTFDVGVKLPHPFNCEIEANISYFTKLPEGTDLAGIIRHELWALSAVGAVETDGTLVLRTDPIPLDDEIPRVFTPPDEETPRVLTYGDALTWIAAESLIDAGDEDTALSLLRYMYPGASFSHEHKDEPPTLTAITPREHVWPNAKESFFLSDPEAFEPGGIPLSVGRKRGAVTNQLELFKESKGGRVMLSAPIDEVDREIISAVSTLIEAAKRGAADVVISPYNICCAMGIDNPSQKEQKDKAERTMRLATITMRLDFTEEARARKLTNPETGLPFTKAIIQRPLVPVETFTGTDEGGRDYVRFRALGLPPTYEHSDMIGHMLRWPQRLFDLKPIKENGTERIRSSGQRNATIKTQILHRVYSLKNSKSSISNTILYDPLCRSAGVDTENRSAKKRVMDFAEDYLRALLKEGEIVDFQILEEGKRHVKTGVVVIV